MGCFGRLDMRYRRRRLRFSLLLQRGYPRFEFVQSRNQPVNYRDELIIISVAALQTAGELCLSRLFHAPAACGSGDPTLAAFSRGVLSVASLQTAQDSLSRRDFFTLS